jgi:hypothetical protein
VVTKSSENGSKNMRAIPKGWRVGCNPSLALVISVSLLIFLTSCEVV